MDVSDLFDSDEELQPERIVYDDTNGLEKPPKLIRYNLAEPSFDERLRLYLKPTKANTALLLLLVLFDMILTWIFLVF